MVIISDDEEDAPITNDESVDTDLPMPQTEPNTMASLKHRACKSPDQSERKNFIRIRSCNPDCATYDFLWGDVKWQVASPYDTEHLDEEGLPMEILRPHDLPRIPFLKRYVKIDEVLCEFIATVGIKSGIIRGGNQLDHFVVPAYMYKPELACVHCSSGERPCILVNVPAPPPQGPPGFRPPPMTVIPLPTCMGCKADGLGCRWEFTNLEDAIHIKLQAMVWPGKYEDNMASSDLRYERIVWFDWATAIHVVV
ncbi:hypothetical protein CspHIS471_0201310 [Cutaneotrichosporon sp. HIS471]|nr:hypothetical protein CspHIS471_0201310 [Cutaneotrichosporon sp. HIS471]